MSRVPCEHCTTLPTCIVRDLANGKLDEFRACSVTGIYKRRQVIFQETAPAEGLHFLCLGAVKLYQSDQFGRDHILTVAGPGEVLSELPLDLAATYSVSAEALTECQVSYMSRDRLISFIQRHPETAIRLIGALSRSLGAARRKAGEFALKRAEGRLAELLMQLVHGSGEPAGSGQRRITLVYSRRELAEMIGVSTETVIRLLARLKQKRVIDTDRHDLIVTDLPRLARLANHGTP